MSNGEPEHKRKDHGECEASQRALAPGDPCRTAPRINVKCWTVKGLAGVAPEVDPKGLAGVAPEVDPKGLAGVAPEVDLKGLAGVAQEVDLMACGILGRQEKFLANARNGSYHGLCEMGMYVLFTVNSLETYANLSIKQILKCFVA